MSDIAESSANNDIALFISNELKGLEEVLDGEWPNKGWHGLLVDKAGGLFQWASLACKATTNKITGLPTVERLKRFLQLRNNKLHEIYSEILKQVFLTDSQDYMDTYSRVMGAILLAKEPLPISALKAFCKPGKFDDEVECFLRPLGALLHGVTESTIPVRPLHTSFQDFLLDKSQSGRYFVDLNQQHEDFATMIFNVMSKELKFNICHIVSSYQLNKDIVDLDDRAKAYISTQLAYACQFWSDHLCLSPGSTTLLKQTEDFVKESFLYWLEVLSVRRHVGRVTGMLLDAAKWMEVSTTTVECSHVCLNFLFTYRDIILMQHC
jgi:hypothetical protein